MSSQAQRVSYALTSSEHEVELFAQGRASHRCSAGPRVGLRLLGHLDADAVRPHRLDVLRPLLDEGDLEPARTRSTPMEAPLAPAQSTAIFLFVMRRPPESLERRT